MGKGFCAGCGKEVGGFLGPKAFQCPGCKKMYCKDCGPKTGLIFKSPTCPTCGVKLNKA